MFECVPQSQNTLVAAALSVAHTSCGGCCVPCTVKLLDRPTTLHIVEPERVDPQPESQPHVVHTARSFGLVAFSCRGWHQCAGGELVLLSNSSGD